MADIVIRNPNGSFAPGTKTGGRPKGFAGVAKAIGAITNDGQDLVDWALAVWKDAAVPMSMRWDAFQWLSDRYFGKPANTIDLNATMNRPSNARELAFLSEEDLEDIDRRFLAAKQRAAQPVIDVVSKP